MDLNVRVMSDVWEDVPFVWVRRGPGDFLKVDDHGRDRARAASLGIYTWDIVDASEEDRAEYAAWTAAREAGTRFRNAERDHDRRHETTVAERTEPRRGRVCVVLRGNKVPLLTVGECFWFGQSGDRVGLRVPGQTEPVWTAASNCEAVYRHDRTVTVEEAQKAAAMAVLGCALLHIATIGARKGVRRSTRKSKVIGIQ